MPEVKRHQDGRPYIVTPEGEEKLYTRASKLSSVLDDGYGLDLWHQRMVAVGLTDNRWILREIDVARDETKELNALCEIARDKAGGSEGSAWGTVVHWFTECLDNGLDWDTEEPPGDVVAASKTLGKSIAAIYEDAEDDLIAYEFATQELKTVLTEQFVVCDEVKAAGSADRISFFGRSLKNHIVDVKTGARIDLSALKFAMQMAIYSRSEMYEFDENTQEWTRKPLPNVDQDRAILIHLPKQKGICEIYWVDIAQGWEAVKFAVELRQLRLSSKKWVRNVNLPDPVKVPPLPEDVVRVADIKEFAKTYSIPLSGKTKKADILEIVKAAEGLVFE